MNEVVMNEAVVMLNSNLGRRAVVGGMFAGGALLVSGCMTTRQARYTQVVRKLLIVASRRAMAELTAPDGFWNSAVARVDLPILFGKPGSIAAKILQSRAFREQLQHRLNQFAEEGAKRAAPVIAAYLAKLSISETRELLYGSNTAATTYLRKAMGPALVNAMIPQLGEVMRAANDPLLREAVSALTGVDIADAAHALAIEVDNAIWFAIGEAEAQIRRDPSVTNDPELIAAFTRR